MAVAVDIDFNKTYDFVTVSEDFKESTFDTVLQDGTSVSLKIEISSESHELMPEVYNLAFGPADGRGRINDRAEIAHSDYSKVFSTILLDAFIYLTKNRGHYVGIDGSDILRAILYFRFIQRNYDYLNIFFNIYGLKYFVRINRFGRQQYHNPFDFEDVLVRPQKIEKGERIDPDKLYNYFIFDLKETI